LQQYHLVLTVVVIGPHNARKIAPVDEIILAKVVVSHVVREGTKG
jgi:hypothetical protein